jgi:hypothetical protein
VTAGRAGGAVTLLLVWTVLVTFVWPILRDDYRARRRAKRRTLFDALISEQSWQGETSPAVRVLPSRTAAASSHPPLAAATAAVPTERWIS